MKTTEKPLERWEYGCESDGRSRTYYIKTGRGSCYLSRGIGETNEQIEGRARLIAALPEVTAERDRLREEVRELRNALLGLVNVATHPQSTKEQIRMIASDTRAVLAKTNPNA